MTIYTGFDQKVNETHPNSSRKPSEFRGIKAEFYEAIPAKPYCTDSFEKNGVRYMDKAKAVQRKYIQLNHPARKAFLPFDLDRPDSITAAEDANVKPPNCNAVNPSNGHGLIVYKLKDPVHTNRVARMKPIHKLAMVERGLTRRLEADRGYRGNIGKNMFHEDWRTVWFSTKSYTLDELMEDLSEEDMRPYDKIEMEHGVGRNVTLFDKGRKYAYRLRSKFGDHEFGKFHTVLAIELDYLNDQFPDPMSRSEVKTIIKSIAKWVWKHLSKAAFSKIQSLRGRRSAAKRWTGHTKVEPWLDLGISRASYYRKKKGGKLP